MEACTETRSNVEHLKIISTSLSFWRYNVRMSDWEHFAVCSPLLLASAVEEMAKNHPYEIIVRSNDKPTMKNFTLG